MRTKSDPVPPLLRTFPWCPPHSEKTQVPPQPTRLCILWPHHLSNLTPPPAPSHPPLQSHWPPRCSSDTALPWGLSTGCSLRLEDSSLGTYMAPFSPPSNLLKHHLLGPSLLALTSPLSLVSFFPKHPFHLNKHIHFLVIRCLPPIESQFHRGGGFFAFVCLGFCFCGQFLLTPSH